ncbi:MAG: hypothetical protein ACK6D3_03465 [Planctomycetaceae bacterium]|jgi:hypothetical protein
MSQPSAPSYDHDLERWNLFRASIEHENELINHRMRWFLTGEAFLLAAFTGIASKGFEIIKPVKVAPDLLQRVVEESTSNLRMISSPQIHLISDALVLIALLGSYFSAVVQEAIERAHFALEQLTKQYYSKCGEHPGRSEMARNVLPDMLHVWTKTPFDLYSQSRIPMILSVAWLFLPFAAIKSLNYDIEIAPRLLGLMKSFQMGNMSFQDWGFVVLAFHVMFSVLLAYFPADRQLNSKNEGSCTHNSSRLFLLTLFIACTTLISLILATTQVVVAHLYGTINVSGLKSAFACIGDSVVLHSFWTWATSATLAYVILRADLYCRDILGTSHVSTLAMLSSWFTPCRSLLHKCCGKHKT